MADSAEAPATTPELRLSPDGKRVAVLAAPGERFPWRIVPALSADCDVTLADRLLGDWTPLVPAPATKPTAALGDRYGHVWALVPGETDWWWSQCKGIALDRATIDAEAGPLDEVDVALVPAPATVHREVLLGLHLQAQDNQRAAAAQSEDAFQFWSGVSGWVNSMIRKLPAESAPSLVSEDQEQRGDVAMLPARWETQIRQVMHQSESLDAEDRTDNVVEVVMSWPRVPSPDGDLVNRVAQAIWHANCAAAGLEPDEANRDRWLAHWTTEARAAITAMQEVPRG